MAPKNNNNNNNSGSSWWLGGGRNQPPEVPGLTELVDLLSLIGSAPPGVRPQSNPELIDAIKNSPLQPVLKVLNPIFRKLVAAVEAEQARPATPKPEAQPPREPTPPPPAPATPRPTPAESPPQQQQHAPVPMDVAELKDIEAGVKSLASKFDAVSQAVADVATQGVMSGYFQTLENNLIKSDSETREAVKASATVSKTHVDAVDSKITQLSGKLDPALHELSQGVKKLQVGLLENAKADKWRLEAKVTELEKEVKELHQLIDATRTELLPVEVASKIALQGTFSEEADKASTRTGAGNNTGNVLQTAKRVRTHTLGLITKCRALFTFINRDPTTGSNAPDLGTEGEWGRCAEHLRASNTRLSSAIEEKEESAQKLQFVGFVVDQIRKGRYTEKEWKSDINGKNFVTLVEKSPDGFSSIQLLAQDISRLTAAAMTAPVAPVPVPVPVPVVPIAPVYGKPPVYGTPPATPAANAIVSQSSTTPLGNTASADTGASTARPNTGGTKPQRKGKPSTNQPPAAIDSPATPTATMAPAPSTDPVHSTAHGGPGAPGASQAGPKATTGSGTPTGSKPPTGSRGATTRTTATNPQTPAEPVETFAAPTSTPVVTAPTSPAIPIVPVPAKNRSEIRPAPPKKSSSYFRSKSEFKLPPLSGWGPLVG